MQRCHIKIAHVFFILSFIALLSCSSERPPMVDNGSYTKEMNDWCNKRIESLKDKNGWLSLAGLFWLKEGENSFGSGESNDIVFPAGKAPDQIGWLTLKERTVRVKINPGINVSSENKPVTEMLLQSDAKEKPTVLAFGSLSWYIIERGDKFGIRLKDSENPNLLEFKGIERYPIDRAWRIAADFSPYDPPKKIPIQTVLGTTVEESSPGALVFKIDGTSYRLDAIGEPDSKELFIVFGDKTNGIETYGAGRFLSADKPEKGKMTSIDFNKAYNPPCAFTEYATCPLPPSQNKLPVKITAGEKKYGVL